MTPLSDEEDRLTTLLRTLAVPDAPAGFLARTRRRYDEALEARYRQRVFLGVAAGGLSFAMVAALVVFALGLSTLLAWFGVAVAGYARWIKAVEVVLTNVPPLFWTLPLLALALSLLPIVSLARARSLARR